MAAPSAVVELTILQTTDVHAHIHDPDGNAGWLRLATAIGEERAAAGGKGNCLLIDCGDTGRRRQPRRSKHCHVERRAARRLGAREL